MIKLLKAATHFFVNNYKNPILEKENLYKFSFSNIADKYLSDHLKRKINWESTIDLDRPKGDLYNIWSEIPGAHKWHHYFSIYDKIFCNLRNRPLKILEIGVYKGASLQMWKQYFHQDTLIVGIDIDSECEKYSKYDSNVQIRIGSQCDSKFIDSIINEFGKFDIIIDDGSHIASHMISSFNYLFEDGLSDNGIYFVEDTHSNYWNYPYRDTPISFVDFTKHLVDLMHYHYTVSNDEKQFRLNGEFRFNAFEVPVITCLIEEIRFFDSIIVIYKTANKHIPVSEHL